jgi:hypothetical protein
VVIKEVFKNFEELEDPRERVAGAGRGGAHLSIDPSIRGPGDVDEETQSWPG